MADTIKDAEFEKKDDKNIIRFTTDKATDKLTEDPTLGCAAAGCGLAAAGATLAGLAYAGWLFFGGGQPASYDPRNAGADLTVAQRVGEAPHYQFLHPNGEWDPHVQNAVFDYMSWLKENDPHYQEQKRSILSAMDNADNVADADVGIKGLGVITRKGFAEFLKKDLPMREACGIKGAKQRRESLDQVLQGKY